MSVTRPLRGNHFRCLTGPATVGRNTQWKGIRQCVFEVCSDNRCATLARAQELPTANVPEKESGHSGLRRDGQPVSRIRGTMITIHPHPTPVIGDDPPTQRLQNLGYLNVGKP